MIFLEIGGIELIRKHVGRPPICREGAQGAVTLSDVGVACSAQGLRDGTEGLAQAAGE